MPTFVINDENKVNSYGFRVLNAGIDLTRFKSNPIMLDMHWNNTYAVLGVWENVRIEGSKLLGDTRFDMEDDMAKKMQGKVERGFIKSCSMGITFDRAFMTANPDGTYELSKCELMEVSLVAIPSNANAITLFASNGVAMDAKEIQLSLQDFKTEISNPKNNMEKIVLSVAALAALGLQNADNANAVSTAIEKLTADYKAEKDAHAALKALADAQVKTQSEALVDAAITEGKLTADVRENWVKLAIQDFTSASKAISSMPGKKSLAGQVNNTGAAGEVKTLDEFEKLPLEKQLSFKNDNPEAYQKLFV